MKVKHMLKVGNLPAQDVTNLPPSTIRHKRRKARAEGQRVFSWAINETPANGWIAHLWG